MIETGNVILDKSFNFALDIISYCETLDERRKYVISNQLSRSGTSVGANVRESQNCESRADFIHKIKIAAKEAEETQYWLLLCKHAENYPQPDSLLNEIIEIQKILNKIISTAKK